MIVDVGPKSENRVNVSNHHRFPKFNHNGPSDAQHLASAALRCPLEISQRPNLLNVLQMGSVASEANCDTKKTKCRVYYRKPALSLINIYTIEKYGINQPALALSL
jgi:hypothetical protein